MQSRLLCSSGSSVSDWILLRLPFFSGLFAAWKVWGSGNCDVAKDDRGWGVSSWVWMFYACGWVFFGDSLHFCPTFRSTFFKSIPGVCFNKIEFEFSRSILKSCYFKRSRLIDTQFRSKCGQNEINSAAKPIRNCRAAAGHFSRLYRFPKNQYPRCSIPSEKFVPTPLYTFLHQRLFQ